jgi:hypothetical protein
MASSVLNPKDRKPYTEYQVKMVGNKTECYIESMEGQPFSVLLSLDADRSHVALSNTFRLSCSVDGEVVRTKLLGKFPDGEYLTWEVKGKQVAEGRMALFEFGATQFTGKIEHAGHELICLRRRGNRE